MADLSDQEWIRLLKLNDPQAQAALWDQLYVFAYKAARRYRQDEDIAHDAALDSYESITTRGIYQFQFRCTFAWYCRQIVTHKLVQLIRRIPPPPPGPRPEPCYEPPEPPVDITRLRSLLQPCLGQLSLREQEAIDLLYRQNQTPEQAAGQMGITRNNVNQIAHRARLKLRACLEARGYRRLDDMV